MKARLFYFFRELMVFLFLSCCNLPNRPETDAVFKVDSADKKIRDIKVKPSFTVGGTYAFGDNVDNGPVGSVIVYPLINDSALFFLDVCRGAPSYNLGQLFGGMKIEKNIGTYNSSNGGEEYNCILRFKFSDQKVEISTDPEHGDCGFGGNVCADNIYYLKDTIIPEYFINGEGDTILFMDLYHKL